MAPFIESRFTAWHVTLGCDKVTSECDNCYVERLFKRFEGNIKTPQYNQGFTNVTEFADKLDEPKGWKDSRQVLVAPFSDLFHEKISLDFIKSVFKVMNETPQHQYFILTKRPLVALGLNDQVEWSDNIYLGVSVGMKRSIHRIADLQKLGAKKKYVQFEPLIEEISDVNLEGIDFVVVGGETGGEPLRGMKKEWVDKIFHVVKKSGTTQFIFKSWGVAENNPDVNDPTKDKNHTYYIKGGCMYDGKLYLDYLQDSSLPLIDLFAQHYYVMDNYKGLNSIWELKSYLPMMDKELMEQLRSDIKTNGINDPILYFTTADGVNVVIEGHTRLTIAMELGLEEFPTKEINEDFKSLADIKLWMIKHQFQRRNLSAVEKIELAYLSKDLIESMARENLRKGGKNEPVEKSIDTHAEIAKIAGVGRSTVIRYGAIVAKAPMSVLKQLRSGEVSITTAYDRLKIDETEKGDVTPKTEPAEPTVAEVAEVKEKKPIEIRFIESIDHGKELLNSGEVGVMVMVKDPEYLEMFNTIQKKTFGFHILKD
jgi:protein gp37/ParB-like chromosome segregation protein Spo0J